MCGTKLGLITERVLDPYAYYRTLVDVTKELWSPSSVECVGYCYVLEENAFCFAGALVHNPSDNFECKYTSDPFKFMGRLKNHKFVLTVRYGQVHPIMDVHYVQSVQSQ